MLELRRKIYNQLDPKVWTGDGMSPLNAGILIAVLISIFIVILQSEPVIFAAYTSLFICLLYTSPSPRDLSTSRMPSSA